jgi:hypothetical protein
MLISAELITASRAHHRERDHERQELDAERPVRVQRRPARPGEFPDELQVAERRQEGDHERAEERHPERTTDLGGDRTGQGVDPGAENVADDEEEEEAGSDGPFERGVRRGCRCRRWVHHAE